MKMTVSPSKILLLILLTIGLVACQFVESSGSSSTSAYTKFGSGSSTPDMYDRNHFGDTIPPRSSSSQNPTGRTLRNLYLSSIEGRQ